MVSWLLQKSIALVPWGFRELFKRQPILARVQQKLLKKFLYGREFIHVVDAGPAQGLRYAVVLPEDKGVWMGTYESLFANTLASAVHPGDVCYDVGGWRGFFSGVMALAEAHRVFVFEPLPQNLERIQKMIELNPTFPIELFGSAIGEEDGQSEFLVMPDTSMGKLAESTFQPEAEEIEKVAVNVCALDSLIDRGKISPPNVVKIDVEGAELLVLKGFVSALKKYRPVLLMEIHSHELAKGCADFLGCLGYGAIVLETMRPLDFENDPTVCHIVARHLVGGLSG